MTETASYASYAKAQAGKHWGHLDRVHQCRGLGHGKGMTEGQQAHWNIAVYIQSLNEALLILR